MFNSGDKVIWHRQHHAPELRTVLRATKTTVTLDNGRKFSQAGIEWGASGGWNYDRIERHNEAEWVAIQARRAEIERGKRIKALRQRIADFVLNDLTDDEAEALAVQLRQKGMPQ
jgi:hypothetical protein